MTRRLENLKREKLEDLETFNFENLRTLEDCN